MSPENITPEQLQVIVGQLSTATEHAAQAIKNLNEGAKEHDRSITTVMTTLKNIDGAVGDLVKIIHKGNGTESMMSQLAVAKSERKALGRSVDALKDTVEDLQESLNKEINDRKAVEQTKLQTKIEDSKADSRQARNNIVALVVSTISAMAAIGAALIALLGG